MYDAADVWTHGVDGSVGAEACGVNPQVGGALFDHIPDDVDLHLGKQGKEPASVELMDHCVTPKLFLFLIWRKGTQTQAKQAF